MAGKTRRTVKLTETEARLLGETALAVGLSTEEYIKEAALRWTQRIVEEASRMEADSRRRQEEVHSVDK